MEEKLNIAIFVDYDNIEIGVKSTLRREFDVAVTLDALRERGDIVAKFAYANWGRQERAARQMSENAVQMVQRHPSSRGDKNGGDINLALDALEMAFTHDHINAFAIVSGDSDFTPLVNKLKEYGKTVFVVGGKAFTSTILQRNCHEFISYESLIDETPKPAPKGAQAEGKGSGDAKGQGQRPARHRAAALDLNRAVPLVERALNALERRSVQPQLGLLKSTMLQLDPRFSEKAYGAGSFSEFVEKLRDAGYLKVSGTGGQATIESKTPAEAPPPKAMVKPDEALAPLRDVLENHRLEVEEGCVAEDLETWMAEEKPVFDLQKYGFTEFAELLNFAQDKSVVRVEPDEEEGLLVYLGAEFYPPALPEGHEPVREKEPDHVRNIRRRRRRKAGL
ncbi:MAG: NYN domain-containing protein [Bryobacteraceae bacterium]|nr:NYN domain-containing protein [Bryobacteraceae bacterium]